MYLNKPVQWNGGAPPAGLISGRRDPRRIAESAWRVRINGHAYVVFELFSLLIAPLLAETTFRTILDLHVLSRQEFYIFITQDGILHGKHVK